MEVSTHTFEGVSGKDQSCLSQRLSMSELASIGIRTDHIPVAHFISLSAIARAIVLSQLVCCSLF